MKGRVHKQIFTLADNLGTPLNELVSVKPKNSPFTMIFIYFKLSLFVLQQIGHTVSSTKSKIWNSFYKTNFACIMNFCNKSHVFGNKDRFCFCYTIAEKSNKYNKAIIMICFRTSLMVQNEIKITITTATFKGFHSWRTTNNL